MIIDQLIKVEVWGQLGGRSGSAAVEINEVLRQLIEKYGPEPVIQMAVRETNMLPVLREASIDSDVREVSWEYVRSVEGQSKAKKAQIYAIDDKLGNTRFFDLAPE